MIGKISKNTIQWNSPNSFPLINDDDTPDILTLKQEESDIDLQVSFYQNQIKSFVSGNGEAGQYAYVEFDDVRSAKAYSNQTVLILKVPEDTLIEVPEPVGDAGKGSTPFQLSLFNEQNHPMEVFVISQNNQNVTKI